MNAQELETAFGQLSSAEEDADGRAGILAGLRDCDKGRARLGDDWAAFLRREFNLPALLSGSELTARRVN